MIGSLEQLLVVCFILFDKPEGMGFLVTAKSILRFDTKESCKRVEYVLVGTFLSVIIAIAVGYIALAAIS